MRDIAAVCIHQSIGPSVHGAIGASPAPPERTFPFIVMIIPARMPLSSRFEMRRFCLRRCQDPAQ
jgi:hypothetical protein